MGKRYFIDMDGTLAKWNSVSFEQLYEKNYFLCLEPNIEMIDLVNKLIYEEKEVYTLSAFLNDSRYALIEKNQWLDMHCPQIDENHRLFVPYGQSKALFFDQHGLIPIISDDILIDDYTMNLVEWEESGGTGVKYMNGINHTHGTWKGNRLEGTAHKMFLALTGCKLYVTYLSNIDDLWIKEQNPYCFGLYSESEGSPIYISHSMSNIGYLMTNRDIMQDAIHYGVDIGENDCVDYADVLNMYKSIEYINLESLKEIIGVDDDLEDDMELM